MTVYFKQADTFKKLSMNAANFWVFVPDQLYDLGVIVGILVSAAAGLGFSIFAARMKDLLKVENLLAAAAFSLLLMPFVLPKMHDRYFYAFEMTSILLACLKPRFAVVALAAQVDGVIAYLAYYGTTAAWFGLAVIGNAWILCALGLYLWRRGTDPKLPDALAFSPMRFAAGLAALWATYALIV